jgi:hypothetical protein
MYCYVLLALNSKLEQTVDSLPPLGFEQATFGTLAHLSDRSAKSHPKDMLPKGFFTLRHL